MPTVYTTKESIAEVLAEQLTEDEFIQVVMDALDMMACLETDERLIANIWNKSECCYDMEDEEVPTLQSLVKQYIG